MENSETFNSTQRPTILIVDDVRINQEVLAELLKKDYHIKVASNGLRALDIAQRHACLDLILLDINMPEMDGYEVCLRLKEKPVTREIPVIFITGEANGKSETRGLQLGAVDYISKPFNPDTVLLRVANQILLRQSLSNLRLASTVFENTMEGIVVTDARVNIINVNPAFTLITGFTLDDVLGKNPKIFQSGRQDKAFYQAMWQEINSKGYWQGEIWDIRKDGAEHAKLLKINTIFDAEGNINNYLALFSDITARKQDEEEIKRLSDSELNKAKLEAEKANKAKSEFLSSMSHELRTPMNAVLGFAQLLETDDLTEDQHDSVEEILTAGHHLMDLINEVLDLSKIEADKLNVELESCDINTLVQNCLVLMQPLTTKNAIKLIDDISTSEHITVLADPLRLKQVLLNLISNAIKYNRVGGNVTLSYEVIDPKTLKVSVTDTGNGLSEEQLSKLFQPFERFTAKNSNIEGTGIGLCISKKLIEAMNGEIGISSSVGVGSCFWVEVPLA